VEHVTAEELDAFGDAFWELIKDSPDGTFYFDTGELVRLVHRYPAAARRQVDVDLLGGVASPRLLRNALLIASAIAADGDDRPLHEARERVRDLEAEDEIGAFTFVPDASVPGEVSPARAQAIDWWDAHPSRDDARCDNCGRPVPRGEGYIVDLGSVGIGPLEAELGESLVCVDCYLQDR
jgi:hypothetical protein